MEHLPQELFSKSWMGDPGHEAGGDLLGLGMGVQNRFRIVSGGILKERIPGEKTSLWSTDICRARARLSASFPRVFPEAQ